MSKIETNRLQDSALDWAVAKCEKTLGNYISPSEKRNTSQWEITMSTLRYSNNWHSAGPIIEENRINLQIDHSGVWIANQRDINDEPIHMVSGNTPLEASMRCYVMSKLGKEVDVPMVNFSDPPYKVGDKVEVKIKGDEVERISFIDKEIGR